MNCVRLCSFTFVYEKSGQPGRVHEQENSGVFMNVREPFMNKLLSYLHTHSVYGCTDTYSPELVLPPRAPVRSPLGRFDVRDPF